MAMGGPTTRITRSVQKPRFDPAKKPQDRALLANGALLMASGLVARLPHGESLDYASIAAQSVQLSLAVLRQCEATVNSP